MKHAVEIILTLSATFKGSADQQSVDAKAPFHTARWSRKIARKLPECLLCERKHVPGLILGLIPGWGPSNIAGFSPGTSAV